MNTTQKLSGLIAALLCAGAVSVQAGGNTYKLAAITCGNWNNKGVHGSTTLYQIGYSSKLPNEEAAYYEFNMTPAKGKTVTGCTVLIIGSTDYDITTDWTGHPAGQPSNQFKVGIAPESATGYPISQSEILTGNNNTTLYTDATDANRNPDLGYSWVQNGLHPGQQFDAFHYESTGQRGPYIQDACNAGGDYVVWACDRFDGGAGSQNYIWGSTSYTADIVMTITTSN